jgi:hypothetical protein
MTDLEKLIAAVEAGAVDFDWGFAASPSRKALPMHWHDAMNAYLGSLDAAHRLHDALLPGWHMCNMWMNGDDSLSGVEVWHESQTDGFVPFIWIAEAPTPARAWLLAILRALKAKGDA